MQRAFLMFAMHNRWRAAAIAALGMVPNLPLWIVSVALVGLACLRHGVGEALFVAAWAASPIGLWSWLGPGTLGLSSILQLTALPWIVALAWLLRRTDGSWSWALIGNIAFGALFAAALVGFGDGLIASMITQLEEIGARLQEQLSQDNIKWPGLSSPLSFSLHVAGAASWIAAMTLVLSRYWQSLLDNPGGFGIEFRRLRLPPLSALTLAGLMALAIHSGQMAWVPILALPLLLASMALVHQLNAGGEVMWLGLFYLALLLVPQLLGLLVVMAVADSFVDFRRYLRVDAGSD